MSNFNPQNFAMTDKLDAKLRPGMAGVRYENGYQVASNRHILCALKEPYPEEYEGKTVNRKGETNSGKFPEWKCLIPKSMDQFTKVELDLDKFDEYSKEAKKLLKDNKIFKTRGIAPGIYVRVQKIYFKIDLFRQIVSLMRHLKTNTIFLNGESRAAIVNSGDSYGLIMPYFSYGITEEDNSVDDNDVYLNRVFTLA